MWLSSIPSQGMLSDRPSQGLFSIHSNCPASLWPNPSPMHSLKPFVGARGVNRPFFDSSALTSVPQTHSLMPPNRHTQTDKTKHTYQTCHTNQHPQMHTHPFAVEGGRGWHRQGRWRQHPFNGLSIPYQKEQNSLFKNSPSIPFKGMLEPSASLF